MRNRTLIAVTATLILGLPAVGQAQGTLRGAERGANEGAAAAGPIGGIVGGAVGAATGTVGGILGIDDRPRFRSYVERERVTSYRYDEDVRVGAVLPSSGVTYREMPAEYHVRGGYRYTVVNDQTVIVDPRTHRIVEVIE